MSDRELRWKGPWLAGFAPVGSTGYVVIVQSRDWVGLGLLAMTLALAGVTLVRWRKDSARLRAR